MHNLRYITEKHFIHLDFMYFWYESELLTYRHSVIFRGGFMLWLEVVWGRGKLEWSYAPVWEDIHPYQVAMCCFLYLAVPPKPALASKGNYFSVLENYKISRATSQRHTNPCQHCPYEIISQCGLDWHCSLQDSWLLGMRRVSNILKSNYCKWNIVISTPLRSLKKNSSKVIV